MYKSVMQFTVLSPARFVSNTVLEITYKNNDYWIQVDTCCSHNKVYINKSLRTTLTCKKQTSKQN